MKKALFLMLVFIAWTISLSAQITREQADVIVWEHIQNEVTPPCLLYVYEHAPSAEGIVINTYKEETVKVKYACWAYYLNENPGVSEPTQHRYLFVKESDGNLLEIITTNDVTPELTEWEWLPSSFGLGNLQKEIISIFPNPTTGELRIENGELRIRSVEVFDVYGRKLQSKIVNLKSEIVLDISHLNSGIYFVKISTEQGEIVKKIIKQ